MSYMMLIFESADALAARKDERKKAEYWGAWGAYHKALQDAGVITGGASLQPAATGTTLRLAPCGRGERICRRWGAVCAVSAIHGLKGHHCR